MTGRIPHPYTEEAALEWVNGLAEREEVFGIEREGELIGICGFTAEANGDAELGYWLGKAYWGQGYATGSRSRGPVMAYGFAKAGVRRFVCKHLMDNGASGVAMIFRKLGFRLSGSATGW